MLSHSSQKERREGKHDAMGLCDKTLRVCLGFSGPSCVYSAHRSLQAGCYLHRLVRHAAGDVAAAACWVWAVNAAVMFVFVKLHMWLHLKQDRYSCNHHCTW